MNENKNYTEIKYALFENPLNIHSFASNKATVASKFPNINAEEDVVVAPGQGATMKNKHFLIFFPKVNLALIVVKIFQ